MDFVRGAAVMGILVANLPGFALPRAAYFSPLAWGGTAPTDLAAWALTFVLVEGKMRGLFALLFGASVLLVVERAEAAGQNAAAVHLRRMATLFVIGCAHLYLLWWGDILNQYALLGIAAFLFAGAPTRLLVAAGLAGVAVAVIDGASLTLTAYATAPRATTAQVAAWEALSGGWGVPPTRDLLREIATFRGDWLRGVGWRWGMTANPFATALRDGAETLGYMLLGMAAYRGGLLTGGWSRRGYRRLALATLPLTLAIHVGLALATWRSGFDLRRVLLASMLVSPLVRPAMVLGYAALLLLAFRPAGTLSRCVAAAGRMALSNYLATSLVMVLFFDGWGLGQFARWPRASLYWLVPVAWTVMLLWSPWWLRRFAYGPAEWVWRALARGERPAWRAV
ncbi:DUF418 domain-containing protein [Sphingomonas sp. 36D10-4-7]|uniref:DUF418 domain-containing protein n=2 Tax=Sphingomonas corticis TaxID=2722791 RepID=A0ABX1CH79_9SPHN|nr:DUF418 domain-containing protein [Sphingomonas corticis]